MLRAKLWLWLREKRSKAIHEWIAFEIEDKHVSRSEASPQRGDGRGGYKLSRLHNQLGASQARLGRDLKKHARQLAWQPRAIHGWIALESQQAGKWQRNRLGDVYLIRLTRLRETNQRLPL